MAEATAYDKETRSRVMTLEGKVQELQTGHAVVGVKIEALTGAFDKQATQFERIVEKLDAMPPPKKAGKEAGAEAKPHPDRWHRIADRVFSLPGAIITGALLTALSALLRGEPVDQAALVDAMLKAEQARAAMEAAELPTRPAPEGDALSSP